MNKSRWLIVGLVVSVLLNVALIGAFVGRHMADGIGPPRGGNPLFGVMRFTKTLPEARQAELSEILRQYRQAARPNIRMLRGRQEAFRAAMLAEPMDALAVRASLDALQQALADQHKAGHEALVMVLENLTAEERQALDEQLRRRRPPRHGPP